MVKKGYYLMAYIFLCFSTTMIGTTGSLSKQEKKAMEAIWLYSECLNLNNFCILAPVKYSMSKNGELSVATIENKDCVLNFSTKSLDLGEVYYCEFIRKEGNIIAINISRNCDKAFAIFNFLEGRPSSVTQDHTTYQFIYNDKNQISKIAYSDYVRTFGFQWEKSSYLISYSANGKPLKISKLISVGKGYESNEVIEQFSYIDAERILGEPGTQQNSVRLKRYKSKKAASDSSVVYLDCTISDSVKNDKEIYQQVDNRTKKEVSRLIREYKNGMVVRTESGSVGYKTVSEFLYSKDKKLNKIIKINYNPNGLFHSKFENSFIYSLREGSSSKDICSYVIKTEMVEFNAKGEPIMESKDGQLRHKNENGEWGPWEHPACGVR